MRRDVLCRSRDTSAAALVNADCEVSAGGAPDGRACADDETPNVPAAAAAATAARGDALCAEGLLIVESASANEKKSRERSSAM
jgi:hypothetical protein